MSRDEDVKGPIILWIDNGSEGWSPSSYQTIKEALMGDRYTTNFIITRLCDFDVKERGRKE